MNSNSLSSSLSHRESENFEFFLFLFLRMCGNWNSAFPCFYGILNSQGCEEYAERERERERERVWSVLVETALDLLRLISP